MFALKNSTYGNFSEAQLIYGYLNLNGSFTKVDIKIKYVDSSTDC
jgi:hypothetical protein